MRGRDLPKAKAEDVMDQGLICELNLALVPDETLAQRHIALSQQVATRYPAVIQLNGVAPRLVFTPHLTLYQVPVPVRSLPGLYGTLADLSAKASKLSLAATEYCYNQGEASFEIRYDTTGDLTKLQAAVIGAANPLRGDLLIERDPAGHCVSERIAEPGTAGDNIRRTGFDAVGDPARGGLFHAHVTINWLRLGTSVDLDDPGWPPLSEFNGRFVALGVFVLGPYGTCAQRLAVMDFPA